MWHDGESAKMLAAHMGAGSLSGCFTLIQLPHKVPGKASTNVQVLRPLHPDERPRWSSWLLTLAGFCLGCYGHLESEKADGRDGRSLSLYFSFFVSVSPSLQLCLSNNFLKINHKIIEKALFQMYLFDVKMIILPFEMWVPDRIIPLILYSEVTEDQLTICRIYDTP